MCVPKGKRFAQLFGGLLVNANDNDLVRGVRNGVAAQIGRLAVKQRKIERLGKIRRHCDGRNEQQGQPTGNAGPRVHVR